MKAKKLLKKIIMPIIILIIITNFVRAANTLTVDTNFLQQLFESYISSEDFARNGGSLLPGDTAESVAENMVYTYGDWIVAEYNDLYANSFETSIRKCTRIINGIRIWNRHNGRTSKCRRSC